MNKTHRILGGFAALLAAFAVVPVAQAAYPKSVKVTVEVWNDEAQDLHMTYASWRAQGSDSSDYLIHAYQTGKGFNVTLNDPRNDEGTLRYATTSGKKCEFKFAHKATFKWFSISPAPEKSATAKSIGTVPAECGASVTKGTNSMESYTVRFSMK